MLAEMRRRLLAISSVALLTACGNGSSDPQTPPLNTGAGGAFGSGGAPVTSPSATLGAGGDLRATGGTAGAGGTPNAGGAATGGDGPYIPPPGALADIVFTMQSTVQPGGEALMCIYAAMPMDRGVIAVPTAESQFTPGSHHLLAYRTDLTSIPAGQTMAPFPCADGSWMIHERGSYYEAQTPI